MTSFKDLEKEFNVAKAKAERYDELREELKEIVVLSNKLQEKLGVIFPELVITKSRGVFSEKLKDIYNEMVVNESHITIQDIADKFNISKSNASVLSVELRKKEGIQSRKEGKMLYMYYFKPKIGDDESEISPEVKIPTRVSF